MPLISVTHNNPCPADVLDDIHCVEATNDKGDLNIKEIEKDGRSGMRKISLMVHPIHKGVNIMTTSPSQPTTSFRH
jgi:hypothetical protein